MTQNTAERKLLQPEIQATASFGHENIMLPLKTTDEEKVPDAAL